MTTVASGALNSVMRDSYDVVIIGSGFGGSIMAMRLAQAGRSVCVLERGRRWDKREFPRSIHQVAKGMWRDGESYGFVDYRVFRRMDVIQGAGVGGGSLHYFNVQLRTPPEIFMRPEWPQAIKRQLMEPYYDLVHDMLDSNPLSPPPGYDLPPKTVAFLEAAEKAGRNPELVPIAVKTDPISPNRHSGIMQEPCDYSGNCMIGCRTHSKNTLDLNYIPMAEKKGAEVHPLHEVDYLEPAAGGGYKVVFNRLDPDTPGQSQKGQVIGKKVILAAGTLGSTQLLLRSRDVSKTLPNLPAPLGQRFSTNGDMIFAGTTHASSVIDPGQGPNITAGAVFSKQGSKHRVYIEDLGFPDAFMWLLEGTFPSRSRTWGLLETASTYAAAAFGIRGPSQSRIGFESDELFAGERTTRFLPYLGMGTDAGDGRLSLDSDGKVDIHWDPAASMEMFREMEEGFKALSAGAGGHYLRSFLWTWPLRRTLTAHPLGGCAMGDSAVRGVVNDRGEVWGHPDLHVVDGSMIPGALSVNPSMTISALAERAAYWMIHGQELSGAAPVPENS